MKANELMIDDWVYNKNIDKPMQIYPTIFPQMFRSDPNADTEDYNIFPIPLTAEILEKNGFEDIGDDTYQLEEKPCWFWVDFFRHTYGCEYDTSTHEYEDDEHRLKLYGIPSVHELQHALRLCGIKKEIEL